MILLSGFRVASRSGLLSPSAAPRAFGRFSGFLCRRFRLRHGNLHDGDHRHADVARIENRNAFRNLDVLNLDRIADIQAADIDLDEIGQNGGQTGLTFRSRFRCWSSPPF